MIDRFIKKIKRHYKTREQDIKYRLINALKYGINNYQKLSLEDFKGFNKFIINSPYCPKSLKVIDISLLFNRGNILEIRDNIKNFIPSWHEKLKFIEKKKKSQKPLIVLIIPDGQAVRTFIFTDFWNYLTSWASVVILGPEDIIELCSIIKLSEEMILPMPDIKRLPIDTLLRFTHYRNSNSKTHKIFTENIEKRLKAKDLDVSEKIKKIWELSALFSSTEKYIQIYELVMLFYGALYPLAQINEVMSKLNPDLVLNTNAISHNARIWTNACAISDILTVAFVLSWDNLSSKWHIDEFADLYLIWSEEMNEDFKNTFPIFSSKNLTITGSPQFEPIIRKSFGISKNEFFKKYGLREGIPLVLYTTGSKTTFPAEPDFLHDMLQIWRKTYYNRMQFMIRMHPKDRISRYESVISKYPDVPFTLAGKNLINNKKWLPTLDDIELLVDQLNHCDVIVNVASTMTIEGFAIDKPSVNIGFDLGKVESIHYPLKDYYNSKHYSDVIISGAAKLAMNYEELFTYILYYLENPSSGREARKQIFLKKCNYPFDSSTRINNTLQNFIIKFQ